jgi:hypothetical protein
MFRRVLGTTKGDARYNRILNLRVDGVALGDRPMELRAATSNYYGREENEGLAVARVLVDLDLDANVENIERRDRPDVCVRFRDRAPVYVENRFVDRGEIAFGRYCEAAANAFKALAEPGLDCLHVIVNIERHAMTLPDASNLARDVFNFIAVNSGRDMLCERPGPEFATLAACGATVTAKAFDHGIVVQFKAGPQCTSFDGVDKALIEAIERKQSTALGYPTELSPLWLLITMADESVLGVLLSPIVEVALNSIASIDPFDAVIIEHAEMKPVVRGAVRL